MNSIIRPARLVLGGITIGLAISVVLYGCGMFSPRIATGPRITSVENLHDIGLAIRDYRADHGGFPPALSELVPQYVALTNLKIFYATKDSSRALNLPSDWRANPREIDQFSSYVYLKTNNANGIVAFEKTNLWKPTVRNPDKVAVLYSDGRVETITIAQLAGLATAP